VYLRRMLIQVSELVKVWGLKPRGVLHVGAHRAEEAIAYEEAGWLPVIWVEAQPDLVKSLTRDLNGENHKVLEAAVWDLDGLKKSFYVASNSQSSSLLDFGTHASDYPSVQISDQFDVTTKRLDTLLKDFEIPSFVNLDIQGVEGRAIISLGTRIEKIDAIYTEVNKWEVYLGCTLIKDLDVLLESMGFSRVAVRWVLGKGWGDALYLRREGFRNSYARNVFALIYSINFYIPQVVQIIRGMIRSLIPDNWLAQRKS
jgi:FkbM family methyltransferase